MMRPEATLRSNFVSLGFMALFASFLFGQAMGGPEGRPWWPALLLALLLAGALALLRLQLKALTHEDRSDVFVRRWTELQPAVGMSGPAIFFGMVFCSHWTPWTPLRLLFWMILVAGITAVVSSVPLAWQIIRGGAWKGSL